MESVSSLQSSESSASFFADGVDVNGQPESTSAPSDNNSSNDSSTNVGGGGGGNLSSGGNNKKNINKNIMIFVLILAAFLLVVGIAVFGFVHKKKDTFGQCNDPTIVSHVKALLLQHPNFANDNFGINPKQPFVMTTITEFAPYDAAIHKRYCEALINHNTPIKYTVHSSLSNNNAIVRILPND